MRTVARRCGTERVFNQIHAGSLNSRQLVMTLDERTMVDAEGLEPPTPSV
jgi:hypothetical protein